MQDEEKTKEQLIDELVEMRQRVADIDTMCKQGQDSGERFRQLSEATFEAIAITENGRIVEVNRNFLQLFGYESLEAIGMNAVEFVIPSYRDLVRQNISSQHEEVYESVLLRKDGTRFVGEVRGKTLCESDHSLRVTVIRDITQRKVAEETRQKTHDELERRVSTRTRELVESNQLLEQEIIDRKQAEEYLNTVLLNMPAGVAILEGPEFRYYKINKALADINGLSVEAHLGRPLAEVLPHAAPNILPRLRHVLEIGQPVPHHEFNTTLPKDPDKICWFIDWFFPIMGADGVPMAVGTVVLDITERMQAEDELLKTKSVLEEKNRLLTAFNDIAQATLSSLNTKKILENLAQPIVSAGIFRSLMIALVDEKTQTVEVVGNYACQHDKAGAPIAGSLVTPRGDVIGLRYRLDDNNITAEVARTGKMRVIKEWDDRYDPRATAQKDVKGTVAYFIPVKCGDLVLAVLATGSNFDMEEETRRRIGEMHPLIEQVAIALQHANLYRNVQESKDELEDILTELSQRNDELQREIHDRVQAEKALQQAHEELEGSNQELIRVNRSKSELLSIVSHELRTPLTSIDGFARLIYERFLTDDLIAKCNDATRPTIERVKNRIGIVRENTARLGRLINDFLDFSRIERGRELEMDFIHVDLSDIIKVTVETYQALVAEKGLTLSYSGEVALNCEPFTVLGDVDRLRQVLSNLVNNAIKFTPRGGQIIIGTHFVDEQIQLTIRDTGVGIPKDKLETILEPFEQSGSTASRKGGTGLGLAIVKHIIDRHNGTIRVESEEGVGTTIIIMLCEYSQGLHLKLKQSRESKPEAEREGSAVGLK